MTDTVATCILESLTITVCYFTFPFGYCFCLLFRVIFIQLRGFGARLSALPLSRHMTLGKTFLPLCRFSLFIAKIYTVSVSINISYIIFNVKIIEILQDWVFLSLHSLLHVKFYSVHGYSFCNGTI